MDLAERQATNISLVLQEGERCFDKVDQCRLVETHNRLSVDENIIRTGKKHTSRIQIPCRKREENQIFTTNIQESDKDVFCLRIYFVSLSQLLITAICYLP